MCERKCPQFRHYFSKPSCDLRIWPTQPGRPGIAASIQSSSVYGGISRIYIYTNNIHNHICDNNQPYNCLLRDWSSADDVWRQAQLRWSKISSWIPSVQRKWNQMRFPIESRPLQNGNDDTFSEQYVQCRVCEKSCQELVRPTTTGDDQRPSPGCYSVNSSIDSSPCWVDHRPLVKLWISAANIVLE